MFFSKLAKIPKFNAKRGLTDVVSHLVEVILVGVSCVDMVDVFVLLCAL